MSGRKQNKRLDAAALLPGLSRGMGAHVKTKVLPVPFKGRQLPDVRLSDHSPFWDEGYNAVMVTDTSFMRNPHYHPPRTRSRRSICRFCRR